MLVLTRRVDERIFIGNDICVTVISVNGNQIRLGIDAPKNCLILREEVKNGRLPRQDNPQHSEKRNTKRTKDKKTTGRKNK